MEVKWIMIAILVFLIITFLYWKFTSGFTKKTYGEKMWKQWGNQMYYWTSAIMVSGGITVAVIYFLINP